MAEFLRYGPLSAINNADNPIILDDDDDGPNEVARRERRARAVREGVGLAQQLASRNARRSVDGESDGDLSAEFWIEDMLSGDLADLIDLTDDGDDDEDAESQFQDGPTARDQGRILHEYVLDDGFLLQPGMTIELKDAVGSFEIQFLRIESIIQPQGRPDAIFRGWGFARTRQLEGLLPCKLNEVVMVAEISSSDQEAWRKQALIDVPGHAFKCVRVLRITNTPYPEHRYGGDDAARGRKWVEDWGPLVCRYRYDIITHSASHKVGELVKKPYEWALVRINEGEADPAFTIPDAWNLNRWRPGNIPGGSYNPNCSGRQNRIRAATLSPGQRYTVGDVFAGAGGASRGIERAGAHLLFAVDHWNHAAETLASNFPNSDIHETDVTTFINDERIRYTVDILHLSPPCQFWSPAHTVAGKNDEANIDVLFSCGPLIKKFRPRLFTLEQTFGILSPKFKEFFNTLISGFTSLGYSVRWKVAPLANYGVPQLRKRLLMVGAAPGGKLPRFPPPTHSKDGSGGLQPWATPGSVLAPLSNLQGHELHRPEHSKRYDPPKPSWDPNRLARTITTSGGQNYHWDGERDFTLLEYAVLQGFPKWHKFKGNYKKKQIGNAFAPSVVKVLYKHLTAFLLEQDGFDPSARAPSELPPDLSSSPSSANDDELICLGTRASPNRQPVILLEPGRAASRDLVMETEAKMLGEPMDLDDDVDDLSDTETVRAEVDEEEQAKMIDLTRARWGSKNDPYVLSD